jgi:hypothetical protein
MRFSDEAVQLYTDNAVEFRSKLLALLEGAIERGEADPTECLAHFAKITLLPKEYARNYVNAMGSPKTWKGAL